MAKNKFTEKQIRKIWEKHATPDDWGVKTMYIDSLINRLNSDNDKKARKKIEAETRVIRALGLDNPCADDHSSASLTCVRDCPYV